MFAASWELVENAQIDGADLCKAPDSSSGPGYTEVASVSVKVTGDENCYIVSGVWTCYEGAYGDYGTTDVGYSAHSRLQTDDPVSGSTNYCVPIKMCGTEDFVKSKCEGLPGCVGFNYDAACGMLKTSSEYKTPSDNGATKVWYREE